MLTPNNWPYRLPGLLIKFENCAEVVNILDEIFYPDAFWPGREKNTEQLLDRLKDIGENRIYTELIK